MRVSEPILLLTRPAEASRRFAAQLQERMERKLRICMSPLLKIAPIADNIEFGDAKGLVFTSSNAVQVLAKLTSLRSLPAYCVGAATQSAAAQHGWNATQIGQDVSTLAQGLVESRIRGPLMHVRGVYSIGGLAHTLNVAGIATTEAVVYDQIAQDLSQEAKLLLSSESPVFVPLFSPRTAGIFRDHLSGTAPIYPIALSQGVANELPFRCDVAMMPNADAMADATEKLINRVCPLETG